MPRRTDSIEVITTDQRRRRWSPAEKAALVRRTYEAGMSVSLVAVFIPILFMGGVVGRLFREMALTLAAARRDGAPADEDEEDGSDASRSGHPATMRREDRAGQRRRAIVRRVSSVPHSGRRPHSHAALAREDVDDAKRCAPPGDLQAFAHARGLSYNGSAVMGALAGVLPQWPDYVFNCCQGPMGDRYGLVEHELLEIPVSEGDGGIRMNGGFHAVRQGIVPGWKKRMVPGAYLFGLFKPKNEPFRAFAIWVPVTTVAVRVPAHPVALGLIRAAGVPEDRIHIERFGVPQQAVGAVIHEAKPGDAEQAKITIVRDGLAREISFTKDQPSILDAASAAGLEVPFSCTSGVCGTCRAKLVAGEVRMERNFALDKNEVANGFVLTCQAHPITERVTLRANVDFLDNVFNMPGTTMPGADGIDQGLVGVAGDEAHASRSVQIRHRTPSATP